jgi:pimeloyl-ACP methyl ester carboxylesterase
VWVASGLTFTAWMVWSFQAHGVPAGTLESDAVVRVEQVGETWRFLPVGERKAAGLVFLPGGLVDPRAYAPLLRSVAEAGYPVVMVELPWRMARSAAAEHTVAERARAARVDVDASIPWVLSGHSRGAAIVTRLMAAGPVDYQGLALISTTHPRVDLSRLAIPVFKIAGTNDCVAPRNESEANASNLPAGTVWYWIEGGNHAQFGFYGPQLGDCSASIDRAEQQRQARALLIEALEAVAPR